MRKSSSIFRTENLVLDKQFSQYFEIITYPHLLLYPILLILDEISILSVTSTEDGSYSYQKKKEMVNYLIKGRGLQPSKGRSDQPYYRTENARTVHNGQGKRLEMFIHLQFGGSSDTVVSFCILALITCFYQRPHSIESTEARVGGIFNWAFKDKKKNRVSFMF